MQHNATGTQPHDTTKSRSPHNATQHNRTTKRSADSNTTQHNSTQLDEHNITQLQTDMQQAVELVDRPKTPRKNLVKKRCRYKDNLTGG